MCHPCSIQLTALYYMYVLPSCQWQEAMVNSPEMHTVACSVWAAQELIHSQQSQQALQLPEASQLLTCELATVSLQTMCTTVHTLLKLTQNGTCSLYSTHSLFHQLLHDTLHTVYIVSHCTWAILWYLFPLCSTKGHLPSLLHRVTHNSISTSKLQGTLCGVCMGIKDI